MGLTTIQIKTDTRECLKKYGRKDETYDEIIKKLMKAASVKKFYEDMERILENEEFVPLDKI
jgi:hypothetical protein